MTRSDIVSILAILMCIYCTINTCNSPEGNIASIKQQVDLLYRKDSLRDIDVMRLRIQRISDSIRIRQIVWELENIPEQLDKIKKTYNDKRSHINTLPVDSQVSYLSTWLSKEDNSQ